ncbi:MAG: hypothetical protein Q8Q09_11500 [Deltaproteobacteria bacterium]|nr:hypothetical protein [Deltaproteobacteria bacterium]
MTETADISTLEAALKSNPDDSASCEALGRALFEMGEGARGYATLTEHMVNVTAHAKTSPLPSLHHKVIRPLQTEVEVAGERFCRDFVCAQGRVLFFWLPVTLQVKAAEIRKSVRARLDKRLQREDAERGRKPSRPGS